MEKYSQVIFDKNTVEFVTVAAEYCGFLERTRDAKRGIFVDTALKILPLLYLKASMIPPCERIGEFDPEAFVTEEDYELIRMAVADEHIWYAEQVAKNGWALKMTIWKSFCLIWHIVIHL